MTKLKYIDCPGFISIDQYQSYLREKRQKINKSQEEIIVENNWEQETINLHEEAFGAIEISDLVIYVVSLENCHDETNRRDLNEIKNKKKRRKNYRRY